MRSKMTGAGVPQMPREGLDFAFSVRKDPALHSMAMGCQCSGGNKTAQKSEKVSDGFAAEPFFCRGSLWGFE